MVQRYELAKPAIGSFKHSTNAEDNAWGDVVFYNDVKHMIKFYEDHHKPSNDQTTDTMRFRALPFIQTLLRKASHSIKRCVK